MLLAVAFALFIAMVVWTLMWFVPPDPVPQNCERVGRIVYCFAPGPMKSFPN
jgi:hypothetical protein